MSNNSFSIRSGNNNNSSSNFPKVDYEAINAQVKTGNRPARISQIWDLGDHQESKKLYKGVTYFLDQQSADEFVERVEEEYQGSDTLKEQKVLTKEVDVAKFKFENQAQDFAEQHGLSYTKSGDEFTVKGKFVAVNVNETGGVYTYGANKGKPKYVQEVAIVLDFPSMIVDYGSGIGEKPYREYLNSTFWNNGVPEMRGFAVKAVKPKTEGGVWSFAPNSKLAKLAVATEHHEILNDKDQAMNIGLLLGEALNVTVTKNDGGYIRLGDVSGLIEDQNVAQLPQPPVAIGFNGVTVEDLKEAKPRYALLVKIKQANNYEGSDMQKAVEEYEDWLKTQNTSSDDKEPDVKQESVKETKKSTSDKVTKVSKKEEPDW